jgi:hypothetical protein
MVCRNLCERVGLVGGYNCSLYDKRLKYCKTCSIFLHSAANNQKIAFAAVRSWGPIQGIITTERIGKHAQNVIEGLLLLKVKEAFTH